MSARLALCGLLSLVAVASTRADKEADCRQIVQKAIASAGGAKLLAGQTALSGTSRGKLVVNGTEATATNTWTEQGLDRLKWSSEVTTNDQTLQIVVVLDRTRGWLQGNGNKAVALKTEQLAPFRHAVVALRLVESLTPLLDRDCKLSPLGELKVDDKPALGVKVKRKGLPEIDLYFDKKSHLPVKAEMRLTEPGKVDAGYTAYFRDYKKVAGRAVFTRLSVQRDGKNVIDMTRENIKGSDSVPAGTFAEP